MEQNTQVTTARAHLAAAETKGSWTPEDDEKYSATIAALPQEARFQLASRLNDQKIKVIHKPRGTGPRVCPGLCPATRVTTTQPQPGATDVPGKVTPASAVPTKVVPTPAVGKAVTK